MPLIEEQKLKLDVIVNRMTQNKESDEDIQWVVNDFKTKYEGLEQPLQPQPKEDFSFSKTLSNIPSSGYQFVKGVATAVVHPIDTIKNIAGLPRGVGHYIARELGANLDPIESIYADKAATMGKMLKDRYGGWENIKKTIQEDPVGFSADAATLLSGAGAGLKTVGLSSAAKVVSTVGEIANPAAWPGKVLGGARELIGKTKTPEWFYERTLKMPPGSLREENRARVLQTMVRDEKLPLGKATRGEMNSIIKELDNGITKTLDDLSSSGSKFNIDTISTALDNLKDTFGNRPNPQRYYNVIDKVKKDFIEHDFVQNGTISLSDAQNLKKGTYAELEQYYAKGQKPETGRVGIKNDVEAAAKANAASNLRSSILSNPDVPQSVRVDLSREAGLMNARKWVERAANRGQNLDPISLGDMAFGILIEGGVPGAVAYKIATSQVVQSRLALFFAHGWEPIKTMGHYARPTALGAYQAEKFTGLTPQMEE